MMLMVYLDEDMAALFVICSLADMQVVKTVARIPGTGISPPHSRGGGRCSALQKSVVDEQRELSVGSGRSGDRRKLGTAQRLGRDFYISHA